MRLHQVSKQDWVIHLISKLQGRARDACARLTYEEENSQNSAKKKIRYYY